MLYRDEFEEIKRTVVLVDFSPGYRLGDFDCGVEDYNEFLLNDAEYYIEQNVSQVKLLIDKKTADVVGYMALNTDSFKLDEDEKKKEDLDIPFTSVPALKIGKLAVNLKYAGKDYGSYLLFMALGLAEELNELGIGCRFIVVDADIQHDLKTPDFYIKNGFIDNEKMNKGRDKSISMRYDLFED